MSWKTKLGRELAERVADYLEGNPSPSGIRNIHRDYCGHGLFYEDGVYELCTVQDGYPSEPPNRHHPLRWKSREEFVKFLSKQSDYSLSGKDRSARGLYTKDNHLQGNQRLTRAMILAHIGPAPTA